MTSTPPRPAPLTGARFRLRHLGLSMRWWLAIAFAAIAALTAVSVAALFAHRSALAIERRAEDVAVARGFAAATDIGWAMNDDRLTAELPGIAQTRDVSLYVYDPQGTLIASEAADGGVLPRLAVHEEAVQTALRGERYLESAEEGGVVLVGLPFQRDRVGAVVAVSERHELPTALDILRRQVFEAAGLAIVVGALTGLVVAVLIGRRLRRITAAARAIEAGDFGQSVEPGFRDELGDLAGSVDRMRKRLAASFAVLASERDRLERILARLNDGVVAVHADLTIVFASPRASRILGRKLSEGNPLPDPWPDFDLRSFAAALFEPGPTGERIHVTAGDQTYGLAGISARGEEIAVLVLSDVSVEERHERAEREFVANAAHELRTPLQTIVGAVEMLQSGAKDDAADREMFLGHIERETQRLTRLVRALLILARTQALREAPATAPVELQAILSEVAASLKPPAGVEIAVDCPPSLAVVTHRDLLEHALANLGANAAKHTSHGSIELRARAIAGTATIEVADTGSRIRAEQAERVFDRFYRGRSRANDGFGLGLAIAAEAIRVLGGRLEIDSAPEQGTTVLITLPMDEEEQAA